MKALLFSGGIDSTALAWIERPDQLIFIDYGQRPARGEQRAAEAIADAIGVPLAVREFPLASYGSGSLVGAAPLTGAAPEHWPFRNQMLITLAAMAFAAETPLELLIGTVATDIVHADGRAAFLDAINSTLLSQGPYTVRAPAAGMDSVTLLRRANISPELLGWTFSCHTGEWACGQCRGCLKHDEVKSIVAGQLEP